MATSGGSNPPRVGYPFLCRADNNASDQGKMAIRVGEFGKVLELGTQGWVRVVKSTATGQQSGWVPQVVLRFGSVRWGDFNITSDIHIETVLLEETTFTSTHPMSMTLQNLYTLLLSSNETQTLPSWVRAKLKNIPSLLKIMMDGIKLARPDGYLVDLFSRAFGVRQLCNNTTQIVDQSFTGRGIYMRVYRLRDGRYFVYVGFTENYGNRWHTWDHSINSPEITSPAEHLAIAREAARDGQTWMFPICMLPKNNKKIDSDVDRIAEQSFILLFQSYASTLLGGAFRLDDDGPEETGQTTASRVGRGFFYVQSARYLSHYQALAVANTGWMAGTIQDSFEAAGGLNIASPLGEVSYQKQIWVKTVVPGQAEVYRRVYFTVGSRAHGDRLLFRKMCTMGMDNPKPGSKGRSEFALALSKREEGPAVGVQVSTVFEISLTGKPHPHSFARLPELGVSQDWKDAQSIAVRIEWRDADGNFKSRYLQSKTWFLADKAVPGSQRSYADALSLVRYFQQKTVNDRPKWMKYLGVARIREVEFKPLTQEISLQELYEDKNNNTVNLAPARTYREWETALKDAGAERVGGVREVSINAVDDRKRDDCDACFLVGHLESSKKPSCKRYQGTNQCEPCWGMNRPCTWTPTYKLTSQNAVRAKSLHTALCFKLKSGQSIETVEDPQLVTNPGMGGDEDSDY